MQHQLWFGLSWIPDSDNSIAAGQRQAIPIWIEGNILNSATGFTNDMQLFSSADIPDDSDSRSGRRDQLRAIGTESKPGNRISTDEFIQLLSVGCIQ